MLYFKKMRRDDSDVDVDVDDDDDGIRDGTEASVASTVLAYNVALCLTAPTMENRALAKRMRN